MMSWTLVGGGESVVVSFNGCDDIRWKVVDEGGGEAIAGGERVGFD